MCVLWLGSGQRLQLFPKHPQNQDRAGTARSTCGEKTPTPNHFLQGSGVGASLLGEAGSPLPKKGVVH